MGHIAIAKGAINALRLARIDFLPAANPWQKSVLTALDDRVNMLHLAVDGNPRFNVNLTEVLRGGVTYTIDTLIEMRRTLGPSIPLVLIMGLDQWKNLTTWVRWDEYLNYASLAVANREGDTNAVPEVLRRWAEPFEVAPHEINVKAFGLVTHFTIPAHAASSTKIRTQLMTQPREKALKAVEKWLHPRVAHYIWENNLYSKP